MGQQSSEIPLRSEATDGKLGSSPSIAAGGPGTGMPAAAECVVPLGAASSCDPANGRDKRDRSRMSGPRTLCVSLLGNIYRIKQRQ